MKNIEQRLWFKRLLFKSDELDPDLHASELLKILESLCDSFLRAEGGSTMKRLRDLAVSKIAAMATVPPALTGLASLGTAGTGTAISSLSGAAYTSATLAWLGGTVVGGVIVVGGVTFAIGFAGYKAIQFLKKRNSRERSIDQLPEDEEIICEGIFGIAQILSDKKSSSPMLLNFWSHNLEPILSQLESLVSGRFEDWDERDLKKLKRDIHRLEELRNKTEYKLAPTARFSIAAFNAVVTKFFIEASKFTKEDELVMDAFRRSTNSLDENSSAEEIGAYVRSFDNPQSYQGMLNNVKGIYHELAFAEKENTDGDEWFVELSAKTNEPGVDVWLCNDKTGERVPYQLKASDRPSSTNEHYKDSDVQVLATDEIVDEESGIYSSGFSNEEITAQTESTTEKLALEGTLAEAAQETATAAAITAAISFSIGVAESLKNGCPLDDAARQALKPAQEATTLAIALATITEFTIL